MKGTLLFFLSPKLVIKDIEANEVIASISMSHPQVGTHSDSFNIDDYSYVFEEGKQYAVIIKSFSIMDATNKFVFTYTRSQKTPSHYYNATWVNYNGEVLHQDSVLAGQIPTYRGLTPMREPDGQYSYTFAGDWTSSILNFNGDVVYTAKYTQTALQ